MIGILCNAIACLLSGCSLGKLLGKKFDVNVEIEYVQEDGKEIPVLKIERLEEIFLPNEDKPISNEEIEAQGLDMVSTPRS